MVIFFSQDQFLKRIIKMQDNFTLFSYGTLCCVFQLITFCLIFQKGIVSKLMIKFWMCQKCGKMKDYNKRMTTSAVE
jgi:hypothetical protein